MTEAERLRRARSLLREAGLDADVEGAGRAGEIAAVRAAPEQLPSLERLAPGLRSLGFRYVALELAGAEPNQGSK